MSDRFERHAWTVTLLTLVSRFTGLVRDAALSRTFGAGPLMDAFAFAFMIPNLFRRLFGEGALSAAFLPAYSKLDRSDALTARRLASLMLSMMVVVLGGLTLVGEVVLVVLSARSGHENVAIWLAMIMLPYMPLVCMVAILGAMLQVHGKFGPTASSPIVLNVCLVAAALGFGWIAPRMGMEGGRSSVVHVGVVAGSVLVAGVLQVGWSLWALRGRGWWVGSRKERMLARPALGGVLRQAMPMFLGLGVLQLNTFLDGLIASYPTAVGPTIFGVPFPLESGAMASLGFAQRLYEFPLGVFGIAVATAIFPLLAKQANDEAKFLETLRRGLRLVVFIGLPASVGLILVREPLTAVILQGGDFTPEDTRRVSFVLLGYAPAIWAYSMTHVLTRAFYARGDAMTPVKIAVGMVALNLVGNVTLIWTPLREAGLAWSTAGCAMVQTVILAMMLRRRVGGLVDGAVRGSWLRTMAATAVMVVLVTVGSWYVPAGEDWGSRFAALAVLVVVGAGAVVGAAAGMGMPELGWAVGRGGQRTANNEQRT